MAGLNDLAARSMAANSAMGGGQIDPSMVAPEEMDAPEAPEMDIEGALAGVEAALETVSPEAAEQAREHINAIREIVTAQPSGGEGEEMPADVQAGPEPPKEGAGL